MGIETSEPHKFGAIVEKDGKQYRLEDSGFTIKGYYSHEGPGWDYRFAVLEEYGVSDPEDLPDVPYYKMVEIQE